MLHAQWQEIMQHPQRPLTDEQLILLEEQNIAALSCEDRAALGLRLLIECRRTRMRIQAVLDCWDTSADDLGPSWNALAETLDALRAVIP